MKLKLLETWSKRHTGELGFALPDGWQLATHQWEVYEALHDPDIDVVFDTAMTGDGKSLAAFLPLLRSKNNRFTSGLFAYPTNELIKDQENGLAAYQEKFAANLRTTLLNGPTIASYKEEIIDGGEKITSYSAIRDHLFGCNILLTNPDIFNLVYTFAYVPTINPATLAQEFSNRFPYIVFDEFHIFNTPQIAMILDALLFIKANTGDHFKSKFLFLSATPQKLLEEKLQLAGLRHRMIEGSYSHGQSNSSSHRKILEETVLELQSCEANSGGILSWIKNNVQVILDFFIKHPDSKGAIICNSVFAAKQVYGYLLEVLKETTIDVGENTGLTGKDNRQASYEKKLMVATSTVDVGVDFKINFLIFESLNAGTFIQRLGRLGRHEGFSAYQAIALLPEFMVQRLNDELADVQVVERPRFFSALESVFPAETEFRSYISRWGGLRVIWKLQKLSKGYERNKLATLLKAYQPKVEAVFNINRGTWGMAKSLENDYSLYEELLAFRGASQMDVWVYDSVSGAVSSVNVLRLLSGVEFYLITRSKAETLARGLKNFYPNRLGLYAKILNYREERIGAALVYEGVFRDDAYLNHAKDRVGFRIESPHPEVGRLSNALETQALCTCVVQDSSQSLRKLLRLPPFFEILDVRDTSGAFYAVAFGQDALLLDSLVHYRKVDTYAIC